MNVMDKISSPSDVGMDQGRLNKMPGYFQAYLDRKKFSGLSLLVARQGKIVHQSCIGVKDWDTGEPITSDTIFRIYSMSKPITSVALMMLYEEGLFRLEHEVSKYLPEFADQRVWKNGDAAAYQTQLPERGMIVRDLLTHTSGLTYDFMHQHPVDRLYRRAGLRGDDKPLDQFVQLLAKQPLVFSPGTRWNYSFSTDVCGRLVEVLSGMSLDQFFRTRIFEPLGMVDTGFRVPADKVGRFASCYERNPKTGEAKLQDKSTDSPYLQDRKFFSGGGGLVSTMGDYYRFCQMLLNGGELDGARLLSPTTIDFMTQNHLPDNKSMKDMGDEMFSEARMEGSGFGLGFSVIIDPVETMAPVSPGAFSWGGAASTYFWIDPQEDLIGISMTQLMPSNAYPIRPQFQTLTYAAIVD